MRNNYEPVALNYVNELVCRRIAVEVDFGIRDAVFATDTLHGFLIQVSQINRRRDANTTSLLLLHRQVGWVLVQSDAEPLQLFLEYGRRCH